MYNKRKEYKGYFLLPDEPHTNQNPQEKINQLDIQPASQNEHSSCEAPLIAEFEALDEQNKRDIQFLKTIGELKDQGSRLSRFLNSRKPSRDEKKPLITSTHLVMPSKR
jgi:hypothetical protein